MGILLAFAPFFVFAAIARFVGPMPGLVSGAVVAAALLARDLLGPARSAKTLEVCTVLLFGGLAAYAWFAGATWPIMGVRLRVDAGLLLIVLASLAFRRPFTLQYARERVARAYWDRPEFVRVNMIISAAWAIVFAFMVAADWAFLYMPSVPIAVGIAATILPLVCAVRFTSWYSARVRTKFAERLATVAAPVIA